MNLFNKPLRANLKSFILAKHPWTLKRHRVVFLQSQLQFVWIHPLSTTIKETLNAFLILAVHKQYQPLTQRQQSLKTHFKYFG